MCFISLFHSNSLQTSIWAIGPQRHISLHPRHLLLNGPIYEKKKIAVARWWGKGAGFRRISKDFFHYCEWHFAATEADTLANKCDYNPQFNPVVDNHPFPCWPLHILFFKYYTCITTTSGNLTAALWILALIIFSHTSTRCWQITEGRLHHLKKLLVVICFTCDDWSITT